MLRKKELRGILKTLIPSVVIGVFLVFFFIGLASAQNLHQSFGFSSEGAPGDMLNQDSLDVTSVCEICDPGCISSTHSFKKGDVISGDVTVDFGGDPGSTVTVGLCSTDPSIIGLSETSTGPFSAQPE